jgi:hypothetical protein
MRLQWKQGTPVSLLRSLVVPPKRHSWIGLKLTVDERPGGLFFLRQVGPAIGAGTGYYMMKALSIDRASR